MSFQTISNNNRGFAALVSVILVTAIIEFLMISGTIQTLTFSESMTVTQQKEQTYYTSESCLYEVFFRLISNLEYKKNEIIPINSYACSVVAINKIPTSDSTYAVEVVSSINKTTTSLTAELNLDKSKSPYITLIRQI